MAEPMNFRGVLRIDGREHAFEGRDVVLRFEASEHEGDEALSVYEDSMVFEAPSANEEGAAAVASSPLRFEVVLECKKRETTTTTTIHKEKTKDKTTTTTTTRGR
jgi:hypothetical protein